MVRYLGTRLIGAIVLAAYTALDFALNISSLIRVGKWFPLITFIAFVLIMLWIMYDLKKANERLLDNHPKITVQPIKEGNICFLRVHNDGAEGIFRVQIHLISEDISVRPLSDYNGFWKFGNRAESRILKGQDDFIKIAELQSSNPPGPISQKLKFWFFDASVNYAHYISTSSHWLGATITSQDGSTRPLTKHKYDLSVVISSSPPLRDGVYQKGYQLTVDGFEPNS